MRLEIVKKYLGDKTPRTATISISIPNVPYFPHNILNLSFIEITSL
jgi:hypothetical protein